MSLVSGIFEPSCSFVLFLQRHTSPQAPTTIIISETTPTTEPTENPTLFDVWFALWLVCTFSLHAPAIHMQCPRLPRVCWSETHGQSMGNCRASLFKPWTEIIFIRTSNTCQEHRELHSLCSGAFETIEISRVVDISTVVSGRQIAHGFTAVSRSAASDSPLARQRLVRAVFSSGDSVARNRELSTLFTSSLAVVGILTARAFANNFLM